MAPCRPSRRAYPSGTRGFSLIELMVVVVIVSILTILAVPSLSAARMDQTAYGDAGAITQLFRSARTRAIGWGAAMLISATASAADRGTFMLYQNTIGGVPSTTCGPPTDWSGAAAGQLVTVIDGVNLNGNAEADASLQATVLWPAGAGPGASQNSLFVCFTPLGRSYIYAAGTIRTPTMFSGVTLSYSPIEIDVQRSGINTVRAVLVPQTGMARLFSKVP